MGEHIGNDTSDKSLISKIYKQHQEEKQSKFLKMGKGPEKTLLHRGHTDNQKTYEKMLNITNQQRSTN